jgi:hypothetical protein
MLNRRSVLNRSMRCLPELMQPDVWNRRESLRVEAPSVNGTGQPRAIARIYGTLAIHDNPLGFGRATRSELERLPAQPTSGSRDVALGIDGSNAMGFVKPSKAMPFGTSTRAFGTPGGGGSLGFADPDTQVGYAYAMNRLEFHMPVDPREQAIRHAFSRCIGGPPSTATPRCEGRRGSCSVRAPRSTPPRCARYSSPLHAEGAEVGVSITVPAPTTTGPRISGRRDGAPGPTTTAPPISLSASTSPSMRRSTLPDTIRLVSSSSCQVTRVPVPDPTRPLRGGCGRVFSPCPRLNSRSPVGGASSPGRTRAVPLHVTASSRRSTAVAAPACLPADAQAAACSQAMRRGWRMTSVSLSIARS